MYDIVDRKKDKNLKDLDGLKTEDVIKLDKDGNVSSGNFK